MKSLAFWFCVFLCGAAFAAGGPYPGLDAGADSTEAGSGDVVAADDSDTDEATVETETDSVETGEEGENVDVEQKEGESEEAEEDDEEEEGDEDEEGWVEEWGGGWKHLIDSEEVPVDAAFDVAGPSVKAATASSYRAAEVERQRRSQMGQVNPWAMRWIPPMPPMATRPMPLDPSLETQMNINGMVMLMARRMRRPPRPSSAAKKGETKKKEGSTKCKPCVCDLTPQEEAALEEIAVAAEAQESESQAAKEIQEGLAAAAEDASMNPEPEVHLLNRRRRSTEYSYDDDHDDEYGHGDGGYGDEDYWYSVGDPDEELMDINKGYATKYYLRKQLEAYSPALHYGKIYTGYTGNPHYYDPSDRAFGIDADFNFPQDMHAFKYKPFGPRLNLDDWQEQGFPVYSHSIYRLRGVMIGAIVTKHKVIRGQTLPLGLYRLLVISKNVRILLLQNLQTKQIYRVNLHNDVNRLENLQAVGPWADPNGRYFYTKRFHSSHRPGYIVKGSPLEFNNPKAGNHFVFHQSLPADNAINNILHPDNAEKTPDRL